MVKDHLGNEYETKKELCKAYNISVYTVRNRLNNGFTLEDALTMPVKRGGGTREIYVECYDHLGNHFNTITAMCRYWNVNPVLYQNRMRIGWSVEDALTKPEKEMKKECTDHLGNRFESISAMCNHYGTTKSRYSRLLKQGESLEYALTSKGFKFKHQKCTDHEGNEFVSFAAMCKYWNIPETTYKHREEKGMTVKEILTTPIKKRTLEWIDMFGNKFSTQQEMCNYWNVKMNHYIGRLKLGWSQVEALTTVTMKNKYPIFGDLTIISCIEIDYENKTVYYQVKFNNEDDIWSIEEINAYKNML